MWKDDETFRTFTRFYLVLLLALRVICTRYAGGWSGIVLYDQNLTAMK